MYLKKTKLHTFLYIFLAIVSSWVKVPSLKASDIFRNVEISKSDDNLIIQLEQEGNFARALDIARSLLKQSLQQSSTEEVLSLIIPRLEEKLLTFGFSQLLFDENDEPKPKFLEILQFIGFESLNQSKQSLSQIHSWAQKNLLRRGERWDEQSGQFEKCQPLHKPLLKDLEFIDRVQPHFTQYDGVIVHGALLSSVRYRLHYLVQQWKRGTRFSQLYFLSGDRPLEPRLENIDALMHRSEYSLPVRKDWLPPTRMAYNGMGNDPVFMGAI
jgi:hypothetical protein